MPEKSDHDLILEIHTVLLGTNGQGGLCRNHESLKSDYYKFKRWAIGILWFLVGSGAIGFSIFGIAKAVSI